MMQNIEHILLVDAGNTRIKWVLCRNTPLPTDGENDLTVFDRHIFLNNISVADGACLHVDLDALKLPVEALPSNTKVVIVNVAGVELENRLKQFFEAKFDNSSISWFKSRATSGNVTNGYDNPNQLGADRWAALIAAWYLVQADCVVVNAGTAVTIDVLNAPPESNHAKLAQFKGGLILPGLALMQQSLHSQTADISAKLALQNTQNLPANNMVASNTALAIQLGALQAVCGAIYNVANSLSSTAQTAPVNIVISGGNAQEIATALKNSAQYPMPLNIITVKHLVPYGLYLQAVTQ